jgi:predicted nucleotidyltransferase
MKTDFKKIIERLVENNFDFILIGGFAAAAYGSSYATQDLDVCAVLTPDNIKKLRTILSDLNPQHRIAPQKFSFLDTPKELEGINNLYLQTDIGVLDLLSNITGIGNFEDLNKNAIKVKIYGHECKIISIADLITSKRTLKRAKDIEVANELEVLAKLKNDSP